MHFHVKHELTCNSLVFTIPLSLALYVSLASTPSAFVIGAEETGPDNKTGAATPTFRELDLKIRELVPLSDHAIAKGRFSDAERLTAECIRLQSMRFGTDNWRIRHSEILRESYLRISRLPTDDQDRVRQALAMRRLARNLSDESKDLEALPLLEKATSILDELVGPGDIHATEVEMDYAATLAYLGEVDKAKHLAISVAEARQKIAGDQSLYHAYSMRCLAGIYMKAGMLEEAEEQLRLADQIYLKLYDGRSVTERILTLATLVSVLVDAKKFVEAEPLARESIRLSAQKMKEDPKLYIQTRMDFAQCLHGKGQVEAAAKEFAEVMSIVERFEASPEYLIDVIGRYVVILDAAGLVQDAARYKKRLSELKEQQAAEQRAAEETLAPPPE